MTFHFLCTESTIEVDVMSVFASMNVQSMNKQEAQYWLCLNNLAYIFDTSRNPKRCAKLSDVDYIYHATKILASAPSIIKQEHYHHCRSYLLVLLSGPAYNYLDNIVDQCLTPFTFEECPKGRRTRSQTKQWRSIIESRNQERENYTQKCVQSKVYLDTFLNEVLY